MIKKSFSLRSGPGKDVCFHCSFQHCTGGLVTLLRQEKGGGSIQIGKEEIKLSFFKDNMIIYLQNPVISSEITIRINEFKSFRKIAKIQNSN